LSCEIVDSQVLLLLLRPKYEKKVKAVHLFGKTAIFLFLNTSALTINTHLWWEPFCIPFYDPFPSFITYFKENMA